MLRTVLWYIQGWLLLIIAVTMYCLAKPFAACMPKHERLQYSVHTLKQSIEHTRNILLNNGGNNVEDDSKG